MALQRNLRCDAGGGTILRIFVVALPAPAPDPVRLLFLRRKFTAVLFSDFLCRLLSHSRAFVFRLGQRFQSIRDLHFLELHGRYIF